MSFSRLTSIHTPILVVAFQVVFYTGVNAEANEVGWSGGPTSDTDDITDRMPSGASLGDALVGSSETQRSSPQGLLETAEGTTREYQSTPPDCSVEPQSMNGASHPRGCAGAVWSNGNWAKTYCDGNHGTLGDGTYPWWAACCDWTGSECSKRTLSPTGCPLS